MTQVEPNFNPKVDCPCGCGLFGAPLKKEHRDGTRHVRGCQCPRCKGRNVKRAAGNRERRIARRVGGERSILSGALSGYDIAVPLRGGGILVIEETTNASITKGVDRWWAGKGVSSKVARILAHRGGIAALRMPRLTVMPTADFDALARIASDQEELC